MPRYDMKCEGCGHKVEVQAPMKDGPSTICPKCNKDKLKQVYQVPAYHDRYSPMHPRRNRGRGH